LAIRGRAALLFTARGDRFTVPCRTDAIAAGLGQAVQV
jgi:hypothetical protein